MVVINKIGCSSRTDFKSVREEHPTKLKTQNGDNSQNHPNNPPSFLSIADKPFPARPCLGALTTAALVLPGLITPPPSHAAEGDEVDFQYSHYQEGSRTIRTDEFGSTNQLKNSNPIEVEGIHGHGNFSITDRIKFAFNYTQDTWGGATPISSAPAAYGGNSAYKTEEKNNSTLVTAASPLMSTGHGFLSFDKDLNAYSVDPNTFEPIKDNRITHILSTASPETRKQGDFKLTYEWDDAAVSVGGGISVENDYESRFGNIGGKVDFNNKQTTINVDLSYTNSQTNAVIDHDANPYYSIDPYYLSTVTIPKEVDFAQVDRFAPRSINANRQDWGSHIGFTQVLNKSAIVGADLSYTRSTGYMANPYKVTEFFFVDPTQFEFGDLVQVSAANAFIERRPEVRNQWGLGGRYVQYINPLDAALHFNYQFNADDWGIQSHTFEADWVQPIGSGWTLSPKIRYYSQSAADFYTPFVVIKENPNRDTTIIDGTERSFVSNTLPAAYSSDHRLSGYGALSGGITIAKQFAKGLTLETGFEYYTHQGGLKIGGGGEGAYADFDYWLANAALKVDLNAFSMSAGNSLGGHHHHDHQSHGPHAPAGIMFDHMLPANGFMVGYRYMWNSQSGSMLRGTKAAGDQEIIANGCVQPGSLGCFLSPDSMTMHMHMLDLMYAPTDWLTLMLMPQFMDMDMSMRPTASLERTSTLDDVTQLSGLSQHISHHSQNSHETGGIGDLGMYALFRLYDDGIHHLHITPGFSAPTADVDIQMRRTHAIDGGFIHYGMQLGSGTWDFKPSVTYTGQASDFSWGAQASGTIRMEDQNESGYRLGDLFQATAWGGYNLTQWLTASVRGVYTLQGGIEGAFTGSEGQFANPVPDANGNVIPSSILKFGPMDYPANYGGKYWDVGFGLSAMVPSGDLAGNKFSVEWLQPVEDDVNGYQLKRDGQLSATWSIMF